MCDFPPFTTSGRHLIKTNCKNFSSLHLSQQSTNTSSHKLYVKQYWGWSFQFASSSRSSQVHLHRSLPLLLAVRMKSQALQRALRLKDCLHRFSPLNSHSRRVALPMTAVLIAPRLLEPLKEPMDVPTLVEMLLLNTELLPEHPTFLPPPGLWDLRQIFAKFVKDHVGGLPISTGIFIRDVQEIVIFRRNQLRCVHPPVESSRQAVRVENRSDLATSLKGFVFVGTLIACIRRLWRKLLSLSR